MNLTFLIPVKLESEDRVRNLKTILTYLLTKFDAKVLVQARKWIGTCLFINQGRHLERLQKQIS